MVQPNLTTVQQRAVWDALQLDSCNTTLPAPPPHTPTDPRRPLPSSPLPATGGIVYVDFVKGSDSASGTSVDDPVKTLGKAQVVARTVAKPPTIVLRGGTHYLDATLALTQADSGLTIQSYPGELATISGASQLSGVTWEPFNVTKGSSATMSAPIPNMNFVYGCTQGTTTPYCTFYGKVDTVEACSDACLAAENCSAYTWHDLNQPPPVASWDGQCYWINVRAHSAPFLCRPRSACSFFLSSLLVSFPLLSCGWARSNGLLSPLLHLELTANWRGPPTTCRLETATPSIRRHTTSAAPRQ